MRSVPRDGVGGRSACSCVQRMRWAAGGAGCLRRLCGGGCGVPAAPVRVRWGCAVRGACGACAGWWGFAVRGACGACAGWWGFAVRGGFGGWVGAVPGGVRPRNGAESVGHRSGTPLTRQPLRADTPRHDPFSPYATAARQRRPAPARRTRLRAANARAAPARRTRLSRRVATPPRLPAVALAAGRRAAGATGVPPLERSREWGRVGAAAPRCAGPRSSRGHTRAGCQGDAGPPVLMPPAPVPGVCRGGAWGSGAGGSAGGGT
ncbi:hypothetical protein STENM327S_05090 [Streptomyces tendae]